MTIDLKNATAEDIFVARGHSKNPDHAGHALKGQSMLIGARYIDKEVSRRQAAAETPAQGQGL